MCSPVDYLACLCCVVGLVGPPVGVRAVGVDPDDAAAPNDVHVGADLVVAGDWMDGGAEKEGFHISSLGMDEPFKTRPSTVRYFKDFKGGKVLILGGIQLYSFISLLKLVPP